MLKTGLVGAAVTKVMFKNTAKSVGSGSLEVFSTPIMIALMEQASADAVAAVLEAGKTTVGIEVQVFHTAPTGVGSCVQARAELTDIQGRTLTFEVSAFDETGQIGHGLHKRVIVDEQRFMEKANERCVR